MHLLLQESSSRAKSMSSGKGKTRQQAKQETREALLRAGIEAFSEQGVELSSLDAICARAGFTRGAFYVHFKDREEFLLAAIDKLLSEFINSVIASGQYGDDLRRTVDLFIGMAEQGSTLSVVGESMRLRVLLEAGSRNPGVRARLAALIEDAIARVQVLTREAQAAGTLRSDVNADNVGSLLVAAAVGLVVSNEAEVKYNLQGMRETVSQLFLKPERQK
jgi:TetR/AcrR family transcriptional regulator, transcriptional repressor for nem operon